MVNRTARYGLPPLLLTQNTLYLIHTVQTETTMTTNPYVQTLLQKGYTVAETRKPASKKQFPCTIGLRTFQTQEEYDEALADFLNGY